MFRNSRLSDTNHIEKLPLAYRMSHSTITPNREVLIVQLMRHFLLKTVQDFDALISNF